MKFNVDDKEWLSENLDKFKDEEDKFVDDKIAAVEEEFVDDDHKNLVSNKFRLEFQALIFKERPEFETRLQDLKKFKVIKYGKFMQALLYFLGYDKAHIVEPGTQKMFWKSAKMLIDDKFIDKMSEYDFQGPKNSNYEKYQTLNYIEKIITGIEPNDVTEFNMAAGRLF